VSEQVTEHIAEPKVTNEISSNTLMGCGFKVAKGEPAISEQGPRTPFSLVLGSYAGSSSLEAVLHNQSQLKAELSEVKATLAAEKALNAKRHEDLLSVLTANLTRPPPSPCSLSCSLHVFTLLFFLLPCLHQLFALFVCTVCVTLVISYLGYFALLLCLV